MNDMFRQIKNGGLEFKSMICNCFADGRITHASISDTLTSFGVAPNTIKSYICGPSAMIEDMEAVLLKQGLNKCNIIYEKWW